MQALRLLDIVDVMSHGNLCVLCYCFLLLIQIRDVDALKTTIFRGTRLFLWSSSGSRAEVEFHGEYQQIKGMFRAEYSYINPSEEEPV